MENKAELYRKMLAYLEDRGADLRGHASARLASVEDADFPTMDARDLLHYQRVLEATIDNRDASLMHGESMRAELTEVVRERIDRGLVEEKGQETRQFRARVASL